MANTFDSQLLTKTLAAKGVTVLGNVLAPLSVFSSDFSNDVVRPLSTVAVPVYDATSAVQKNPSNFATGDTTVGSALVTLNHYSKSFHITSSELNQGKRLESLAEINMQALANEIWSDITDLLESGNFSASNVSTSGASDFDREDLKVAWAEIGGRTKGCVLKSDYFARILPSDLNSFSVSEGIGLFDRGIYHVTDFENADEGVVGFVCAPQALAVASAIPEMHPAVADGYTSELVEVPDLGITIQVNTWADNNTRSLWGSFDVAFGAAVADGDALKLIKQ